MKSTPTKNEMYMANMKILRWGPNATYIPLTGVGVSRWGNANFSVFRYQHVGIPNANGFASQWNIGFSIRTTWLTTPPVADVATTRIVGALAGLLGLLGSFGPEKE